MVYFGNIEDCPENITEIWLVVRSLQPYNPKKDVIYKHVPELSPSLELFFETQKQKKACTFTKEWFDIVYTPNFITQITNDANAQKKISELRNADHDIYVACYCKRKSLCHVSLLEKIYKNRT